MAIRSSGPISFSDLRTEAGSSGAISLGDGQVRDIIGAINNVSMSNAYSKTRDFTFTIAAGSTRRFITTLAYDAGWLGTGNLVATLPQGTVSSSLVTGQNPWGTLSLYNSGFITGSGGNGGLGGGGVVNSGAFSMTVNSGAPGGGGQDGLIVSTPSTNRVQRQVNVINYGTLAAGGGGGGGGNPQAAGNPGDCDGVGGGGGGGGQGLVVGNGGGGGTVSITNGGGTAVNGNAGSAPGLPATTAGGAGGSPGSPPRYGQWVGGAGGTGGSLGAAGEAGGGNAAGWQYQGAGGAAGAAIRFNTNINGFFGNYGTVIGAVL